MAFARTSGEALSGRELPHVGAQGPEFGGSQFVAVLPGRDLRTWFSVGFIPASCSVVTGNSVVALLHGWRGKEVARQSWWAWFQSVRL